MKILMCEPRFYGVEYEINPWMDINIQVNRELANQQWQQLTKTIQQCGAKIEFVEPVKGLPDMVFTANAGLILQNQNVLLAQFKYKERKEEAIYFKDWFIKANYKILTQTSSALDFEGEGDALWQGKRLLWTGFGFRTHREYYRDIALNHQHTLVECELVDPYFYHLDTCFCPISETLALWWPQAFSKESQIRMQQRGIDLLAVEEEEARKFVCNSVVIGKNIIMPAGCDHTAAQLTRLGFTVHACPMSEFIKAGGACKCLTLLLEH